MKVGLPVLCSLYETAKSSLYEQKSEDVNGGKGDVCNSLPLNMYLYRLECP